MKKLMPILATTLLSAALSAQAAPEAGDKSFSLSGTGSSDESLDSNSFGVSGELGYYQSEHLLVGVRQSLNGSVGEDVSDAWNGATRGFVNMHFGQGDARPYVGANIGGLYGDGVNETGTAGVEAGVRWFVRDKTFIGFGAEYAFLFSDGDEVDDNFDDGAFLYTLGVGFNF
ncbi:MAG: outer membrane beta-barrel protein [Halioglobus sp.]|nr:outer membrane beta-barrel protein [Halioglobus sp.]